MMVGQNVHTYDDRPLSEIKSFHERADTYVVQRELGRQLWMYAFPSTFLVPFLIEPIATITAPFYLSKWLVRTHPEVQGHKAESALACIDMDLSRYADLLLNISLATLVFAFPLGFVHQMFLALFLCNIYIYAMDQYKVLRSVKTCLYASIEVDLCAQYLMALPCGILLMIVVYYDHCHSGSHCDSDFKLFLYGSAAFLFHVTLHCLLL